MTPGQTLVKWNAWAGDHRLGAWALGLFLVVTGLILTGGGGYLVSLGGTPYYLVAGLGCLVAGVLYCLGRAHALWVFLAVYVGTLIWGFVEVGADFWQLMPRIAGPTVIAILALLLRWNPGRRYGWQGVAGSFAALVVLAIAMVLAFQLPAPEGYRATDAAATPAPAGSAQNWPSFGGQEASTRYSAAQQITPANVHKLKRAWTFQTGDWPLVHGEKAAYTFEVTPIQVGDLVYVCTSHDEVVALDADTGALRWRFDPKVDVKNAVMLVCRGVAYHEAQTPTTDCPRRLLLATLDGRMIAINAETGQRCPSFGQNGEISLITGLEPVPPGLYYVSSQPTVVGDVAVLGGAVLDGQKTQEPSGVIRGFDVYTGSQLWAWDPGRADESAPLKPGESYSRGSPNSWTVLSGDSKLGLVYVPMGNATPDYVGAHRTVWDDRYSSAIVALDARTGVRRWHYQTVHHDLWDYDIGSQPVLFDFPTTDGPVPAVFQPTKHGDIFVLDRRDGTLLASVEERPVPKGDVPGERYAPTQPFSTGFPTFSPPPLREKDMWGATPLDQLWCRIKFRSLDYTGKYTPPSVRGTLEYPGNFGVIDWGSVAIDEGRGLMIVNSSYMPLNITLIPRDTADKMTFGLDPHVSAVPQKGTPYASAARQMLSPLGIPCNAPPWGKLTAIDLKTKSIVWQRPLGSTRDHAPLHIAVPGGFNLGGTATNAGGVTFIGATIDAYLRAFDTRTGRELWRDRLPAGAQAGAMTYVSPKTGRQYVIMAAGGHQLLDTPLGDYIVAYALPEEPEQGAGK